MLLASLPTQLDRLNAGLAAEAVTRDDLPARLVERMIASDGRARVQSFPIENLKHIIDPGNTIMGQHDVNARDRESLVRMLCNKTVQKNIDAMVTHEFPMSKANEAFDVQVSKQCGKIFLRPQL